LCASGVQPLHTKRKMISRLFPGFIVDRFV
jgi:hypothetical protein